MKSNENGEGHVHGKKDNHNDVGSEKSLAQEEGKASTDDGVDSHGEEDKGGENKSQNSPIASLEDKSSGNPIEVTVNRESGGNPDNCPINIDFGNEGDDRGSYTGPGAVGSTSNQHNSEGNVGQSQAWGKSNFNFSGEVEEGDRDGNDSTSKSIDLNFIPTDGHMESGGNEVGDTNVKSKKKGACATTNPISMKLKDIIHTRNANSSKKAKKKQGKNGKGASQSSLNVSTNSISCEVIKTVNIGKEVGFQLDGFEEILRAEIEGEGASNLKK
ncbi:hypothetical protein L2E82_12137 [Cichorium intybus]|uniref:Uncharacterized protein n=1 Tax=Cichorium intybus TaxID=13427 RepID=A0ACB9GF81_CICIN|nr:hypothetical protein L2E82_12137 [Cichorium intybus]